MCGRGQKSSLLMTGHSSGFVLLAQRSFPLFVGVIPNALLRKDCVSDFELSMRFAIEAGCVPGAIKLLRWGFADRAKEGPGQRSILYSLPS